MILNRILDVSMTTKVEKGGIISVFEGPNNLFYGRYFCGIDVTLLSYIGKAKTIQPLIAGQKVTLKIIDV